MAERTQISELGKREFLRRITPQERLVEVGGEYLLHSSRVLCEGVHFDLRYFPLEHLGYKVVVCGVDGIVAHDGVCRRVMVSLGVSARFSVEEVEALVAGAGAACEQYGVILEVGDVTASLTGLTIAVTAFGRVARERYVAPGGAGVNDLVCLTGDVGAAYMGLQLLERETRVYEGHQNPAPQFEGREELLRRQLAPVARVDIIEKLAENGLLPTAMAVIKDGLAAELLTICDASKCGVRVYLERIPISRQVRLMAEELNADHVVAALNGGDDHEIVFTVPLAMQEKIVKLGGVDIIGHITDVQAGAVLVTPDGDAIPLQAPGY